MRIVRVVKPLDALFTTVLHAVLSFAMRTPGGTIPIGWYATRVSVEYHTESKGMLLLAVLDDADVVCGHCLALVEQSYTRQLFWCYQAYLDKGAPAAERSRIIREGLSLLDDWGRKTGCVALGMATTRPARAMARRFGFAPTVTLLERPLHTDGGA